MQKYLNQVLGFRTKLEPMAEALVTVRNASDNSLASIYQDNAGTEKGNPFTANNLGYFDFYAEDGRYNVVCEKTGYTSVTFADVILKDPANEATARINGDNTVRVEFAAADAAEASARIAGDAASRSYTATASGGVAQDYANKLNQYFTALDVGKAGGDSVQNLVGVTPTAPNGPRAYRATGYYTGTNFGGGTFVWAASQPKNTHNGGWIISPTVPWDGSPSTHAAFLLGTGETAPGTNGCWVKIYENLTLECYGALGNWNGTSGNDDTQEIQRAVDTAPEFTTIKGRSDAWYYYTSITQTRRLKVDFNGARIYTQPTVGLPSWRVRPGFGVSTPELRYNIVGGAEGTNYITMLTPSQASNFTPGEFVFIRSLEFVPGWSQAIGGTSRGSNGIYEATRVLSADTGTGVVTFNKPLEKTYRTLPAFTGVNYTRDANNLVTAFYPSNHNYVVNQGFTINTPTGDIVAGNYAVATIVNPTTITFYTTGPGQTGGVASGTFNTTAVTPQIWKWRSQMTGCGISNISEINEFDTGGPAPASTFPHLFHFWACISPEIHNVYANGWQMHVFNFESCEKPKGWKVSCDNPFRPELGGHGYLAQFTGGTYGGLIEDCSGIGTRHLVDWTGSYDCVSQRNQSLDSVRAAFYTHGLGSKRGKSIDDICYVSNGSNGAAGCWAVGNPAFANDDDFEIIRPGGKFELNYGIEQSLVTFGFRSKNLKVVEPKFIVNRNTSNGFEAAIIRMNTGADGLEVRNADINASGFITATNDAIVDVRPAFSTDPAEASLPTIRPRNVKVFGGAYFVGANQQSFKIDCDGEIVIRPDEIIGTGNAIALDLKSTCVPTVFEYETLLTGAFANDIIRGPTPAANMIWYENIRSPLSTTVTSRGSTGRGAVDLQRERINGTQRASGDYAFAACRNNTAAGTNSAVFGFNNQSNGQGAMVFGNDNIGGGVTGFVHGTRANDRSRVATRAWSAPTGSGNTGRLQGGEGQLHVQTTDATATRLINSGITGAATASNQYTIPNNSAFGLDISIIARNTSNNDCKKWTFSGLLRNTSGTTELVGMPAPTMEFETLGAATWGLSITADNTLDCIAITVTGQAGATIMWRADIRANELA